MNYKDYTNLIEANEKEMEDIRNGIGEYSTYSRRAKNDRLTFLENQNEKLKSFNNALENAKKSIKNLEDNRELSDKEKRVKIKSIKNELRNDYNQVKKMSQGKVRNILSASIGQIDKRIHNFLYREGKLGNFLWDHKVSRVTKRYDNIPGYIIKNGLIALGIILVPGILVSLYPATFGGVLYAVAIADAAFLGNTIIKTGAAIFNKIRYGGPLIERHYTLKRGSFLENIKNSVFELRRHKKTEVSVTNEKSDIETKPLEINNEKSSIDTNAKEETKVETKENKKEILINKINNFDEKKAPLSLIRRVLADAYLVKNELKDGKYEAFVNEEKKLSNASNAIMSFDINKATFEDLASVVLSYDFVSSRLSKEAQDKFALILQKYYELGNKEKEHQKENNINKPNINDYGNIGMYGKNDTDSVTFAHAISDIRNPKVSADKKEEAYAKLAVMFGKNKRNTDVKGEIAKALNDFNRTEKRLAELGRQIDERKRLVKNNKDNNMLKQYTNEYIRLLYHLGKNDEIEDFIADEAYRYAEDKRNFEENERKRVK